MTCQKNTPMMDQYFSIKEKYPDAILFYRMGDFYEMFHEDAEKAADILGITLTSRNKNKNNPVPLCGVPFRAADTYIAKLIKHGLKVAVCEQIEDPALAKGLVKRDVVRVITPGMILNEELLDNKSNNFLVAMCITGSFAGLSFLDISTGLFRTTEIKLNNGRIPSSVMEEALRLDAKELLLPASFEKNPACNYIKKIFQNVQITWLGRNAFNFSESKQRLIEAFGTRSLEGFGCETLSAGISAAGAVMFYVRETQLKDTGHILSIKKYELDNYLIIDNKSCRNLELLRNLQTGDKKGTLLSVLDKTMTSMGGRLLKTWIRYPLVYRKDIEERLTAVADAKKKPRERKTFRNHLKSIHDIERLGSKISMGHGNARDLTALKMSLFRLPDIFPLLSKFSSPMLTGAYLKEKEKIIEELVELSQLIHRSIREDAPNLLNEGGIIKDGFNSELDEIFAIARDGKAWIAKKGAEEKEKTGLSSLKIKFNKVFGYFIEVSKAQAVSVPEHYIKKQTLVNAERFITDELKEVESKVLNAQEQRAALEYSIFCDIRKTTAGKISSIFKIARFFAIADVILCLAEVADENNYTEPEFNEKGKIVIDQGRHPVVEKMTAGERYVPNCIELDNEKNQVLIITGPNMAGKSTVLRQVALSVLMAHMGSFVPADKASICITDRIFTRVGALDNLSQGQSTFMVEMEETANIVNNVKHNSLVILDEIGRGTSTFDGMSIAWAVVEFLHDFAGKGVKTLFATHYHELTQLENLKSRVKNFNIAVKEFKDNIIFLRTLVKGGTNKSYGIQVARLAGVPEIIIERAKQILFHVEQHAKAPETTDKDELDKLASSNRIISDTENQMDLFEFKHDDYHIIIEKIKNIDISSITPVEALNFLNDIQLNFKEKQLN